MKAVIGVAIGLAWMGASIPVAAEPAAMQLAQMGGRKGGGMMGEGMEGRPGMMKGRRGQDGETAADGGAEAAREDRSGPPREDIIETMDNSVPRDHQIARGFVASGLLPRYPAQADCPPVASPFASPTRFDGSHRDKWANHGLHGGIDISLPIGTPILAIADGTLVHKTAGGILVGNQVFLRHAPEDTGLSVWLYSKYKHFDQMPDLPVGSRVKKGQVIGPAGATGTQGKHYGAAGYPHLHLSLFVSDSPDYYEGGKGIFPSGARILDLFAVYATGRPLDNRKLAELPEAARRVDIPYQTPDGRTVPADSRFVWPVFCTPR